MHKYIYLFSYLSDVMVVVVIVSLPIQSVSINIM